MNLFLFILGTIGASHVLADSKLFMPVRQWVQPRFPFLGTLISCYPCNATWVGFLFGFFLISHNPIMVFASGCAASFLSVFAASLLNVMDSVIIRRSASPSGGKVEGCAQCGGNNQDAPEQPVLNQETQMNG